MFKKIAIIGITILCVSCKNTFKEEHTTSSTTKNWKATTLTSETASISFDYEFKKYLIVDSLNGFLIGNNSGAIAHKRALQKLNNQPLIELYENYETVLFKTTNGGLSFKKSTLGKGSLELIVTDTQKNIFTVKKSYPQKSKPPTYELLKSTDMGISWKVVYKFKKDQPLNMAFYDENRGVVYVKEQNGSTKLYETKNGGISWGIVQLTNSIDYTNLVFANSSTLLTIPKANQSTTAHINLDTNKMRIKTTELPSKDYQLRNIMKDDQTNALYSVVTNKNETENVMLYNHNEAKLSTYSIPVNTIIGININDDFIGVLTNEKGKTHYYHSSNKGGQWIKENLPDSLTEVAPVALYGKGGVWIKSIANTYNILVRTAHPKK